MWFDDQTMSIALNIVLKIEHLFTVLCNEIL